MQQLQAREINDNLSDGSARVIKPARMDASRMAALARSLHIAGTVKHYK